MKLWLKETALIAVVASAIGLLDGELFYLSLVRGEESFNGYYFRQISSLIPKSIGIETLIGTISNFVTIKIVNLLYEPGAFAFYFLSLAVSSVIYFRVLNRVSGNSTLSFVLSVLGLIGIVSSTKDFSISLAVLLSCIELLVLTDYRTKIRLLAIPLCFLHYGSDTSYLLPLSIYLIATFSKLGLLLGVLLLLKSVFVVSEGYVSSPYSTAAAILIVFFGIVLALKDRRLKIISFSILTPFAFWAWQELYGQRFPALPFVAPIVVSYIWLLASDGTKAGFKESLLKLEQNFNFSTKNRLAFFWLCLAFIFFQTATKFRHPVNEAYLPKEAMDVLTESRPTEPPLHPAEIGGYVAFRLAPILPKNAALNFLDLSAKSNLPFSESSTSEEYKRIWKGENQEFFNRLAPSNILCQGRDKLCSQLKADDHWRILSHSSLAEKILGKLSKLPVKQREYVSQRLEDESWYLLAKK